MRPVATFPPIPNDLSPEDLVARCLDLAVERRVSDIYFSTHETLVSVQVRYLGLVGVMTAIPLELGRRCIAHIKAVANMDVAEKRRPQDGRWIHTVDDHTIDLRISVIPTLHGEDLTMRLLVRDFGLLALDELGLSRKEHNQLLDLLNSPSGLILVTGPTGSGKTTTLYACLRYLNNGRRRINTIEDPIEYSVEGVRQSQINPQLGVDFPDLLRAVLRQAPDIIMVGEIRDPLTAETAVRAANSGHLVLATLHAPISAGAIQSMLNLGVHPHFLASSLRGVIAQRLARTLCPECKETQDVSFAPQFFDDVEHLLEADEGKTLFMPRGCPACFHSGYSERTGLFEILPITGDLRALILERAPTQRIRQKAIEEGLIEIRQVALLKVARGHTTVEEVLRVVPVEYLGLDE